MRSSDRRWNSRRPSSNIRRVAAKSSSSVRMMASALSRMRDLDVEEHAVAVEHEASRARRAAQEERSTG